MARDDLTIVVEVHKIEEVQQIIGLVGKAEELFRKINSSTYSGNTECYLVKCEHIHQVDQWLRELDNVLPKLEDEK